MARAIGVLLQTLLCVAASEELQESGVSLVTNLTDQNFEELVARGDNKPWVVKFYAPWCGHCKVLAPTWEKIAEDLKGQMNVGKVDCTESQFLGSLFSIHGFPTLKIIADGKLYSFSGRRSYETLVEWAREGYKEQEPDAYPFDKSSNVYLAVAATFFQKYGLYLIGLSLILLGSLVCWLDQRNSGEDPEIEERLRRFQEEAEAQAKRAKAEAEVKPESKKDS